MDDYNLLNDNKNSKLEIQSKQNKNEFKIRTKVITKFKQKLTKMIHFSENYPSFFSLIKLLLGLIIIALPAILIMYFIFSPISIKGKYIIFPYFITISLYTGLLIIIIVLRLGDDCSYYGILISSWERNNVYKIFNSIVINILIIYSFFSFEKFFINLPIQKEMIANIPNEAKHFTTGSHLLRIIFIFTFWNREDNLGYFEYEDELFVDFRNLLCKFATSLIAICMYYLLKVIIFRTKNSFISILICIIVLYECFFFEFFPIKTPITTKNTIYYQYDIYFYLEIIPIFICLLCLLYLSFYYYIRGTYKRKLFSYRTRKTNIPTYCIIAISFICTICGIGCHLFILLESLIQNIEPSMNKIIYTYFWYLFDGGFVLYSIGQSFACGDYIFKLIYGPIVFELCPAVLKNFNYIKCSNNIKGYKKGKKNIKNKKEKKESKVLIP